MNVNKANVYPEQPVLEDFEKGNDIVGLRQETFAIIPIQPGKLVLPKVEIKWWNITKKRFETAILPEETIEVQAAPTTTRIPTNKIPSNVITAGTHQQPSKMSHATLTKLIDPQIIWPIISATFLALWLMTLYFYYRYRSYNRHKDKPQKINRAHEKKLNSVSKHSLKKACFENNPKQAKEELIKLAQELWSLSTPNLFALKPLVNDNAFQAVILLNQTLYSKNNKSNWQGEEFWHVIHPELKKAAKIKRNKAELPPLYPL
ncbi:BatD family protein [Piscirickettsia litoralis]|uniref:DUF7939 domain-containing protein n=1 Tax=Piscirickettsia litoralis TaxID=1891921 RepID=A0ABX3A1B2_9GAMM|nr:BatD family protein [Piscirickettsia litoralis]ODN42270.1 hypothetical protein BGC07_04130 [Piscirickettsia litoralis]